MVALREIKEAAKQASSFDPEYVKMLLQQATGVLSEEPRLIQLPDDPLLFIGDTHGDWETTRTLLTCLWDSPATFVFLGDYVDRGPAQVENINFLYEVKCKTPERLILLRGNHEAVSVNHNYGFYQAVKDLLGSDLYKVYAASFAELPLAAVSRDRGIFAVHGGIAEGLEGIGEIDELPREVEPEDPTVVEMLWNDPQEFAEGFGPSMRGRGPRVFGRDVAVQFLEANKLGLIVRSHEFFSEGFWEYFDGLIMSLFSCQRYMGQPVAGKALYVDCEGNRQLVSCADPALL